MDYEFQIQRHERELAHLREMQKLLESHQDTTDQRLDKMQAILRDATAAIAALAEQAVITRADLQTIAANVAALTRALLRGHPNGQGEA